MGNIDTSIFYDIRKALSYGALLTFIVGERRRTVNHIQQKIIVHHILLKNINNLHISDVIKLN